MEQVIRVSVFLGFFSSYFCREGIRVSDKRVVSATQIGNAGQGTMNPSYQALIEAASDGFLSPAEIARFAPDTPSPDDVECYVDVETYSTERLGGRCVNFGRTNLRICQAGEHSGPLFGTQCRITPQNQPTDPPTP